MDALMAMPLFALLGIVTGSTALASIPSGRKPVLPVVSQLRIGVFVLAGCATGGGMGTAEGSAPEAAREPDGVNMQAPPTRTTTGPLTVGGAELEVVVEATDLSVSEAEIREWVHRSAQTVTAYYGSFPVPDLKVTVIDGGRAIGFGQHWDGRFVKIRLGPAATSSTLEDDWVMVHEMLHAAFPDCERKHKWMQEGLSTYLERITQAQVGQMSDERVWGRFVEAMEFGRPKLGDRGLDRTRTWGRLYWGGALFWMVADVRIRQATNNEKSLRDALRGIVAEGGNGRQAWATSRVVEVGDAATGTRVLRDLYAEMAEAPGDIDLPALWVALGIAVGPDGEVSFDDEAELAHIRRAMTRP